MSTNRLPGRFLAPGRDERYRPIFEYRVRALREDATGDMEKLPTDMTREG